MWTAIGNFFSGPVATYFNEGQKIEAAKSKLILEAKLESIRKGEDAAAYAAAYAASGGNRLYCAYSLDY